MPEPTSKDIAENDAVGAAAGTAPSSAPEKPQLLLTAGHFEAAEAAASVKARVASATPLPTDDLDFSEYRRQVGAFDGTEKSHENIVEHNRLVQLIDRSFNNQLNQLFKLDTRDAQVGALLTFKDKDLAPRHIVQVAQELALRDANKEFVSFLDAQEKLSVENHTQSFFASPEVKQWRATGLQVAKRYNEAARLSDEILAEPGQERNPEALRTRAMAEVARAESGAGRDGALAAFEGNFAKTGDYSLGMGALNAELERGNLAKARQLAPLVSLAAKNVGANESKSFWPAVINAQAAIVGGDEAEKERAVRHLAEVLVAKNENGTPVVSDANRGAALVRIAEIVRAQPDKPEIEAMLRPLAEQLEGKTGFAKPPPLNDVEETFSRRGYTSRAGVTPEGFHIRGNVRQGGMLPDSSTTLRDKMQFLEVTKTPLENFVDSGLIKAEDLPPGVTPKTSLYDIPDPEMRIRASQVVARAIFDVDGRNLEELHSVDHRLYDTVVRLRIEHSGATSIGHLSDEEHQTFVKIRDNPDEELLNTVRNVGKDPKVQLTPAQEQELKTLFPESKDPTATAKKLIQNAQLFRTSDTRTNLAVAAGEGIGDCRHVAAAAEALVSAVQQDKTSSLIRDAAAKLEAGDLEGSNRLAAAANKELNGYEMRIYDQNVQAAVEVKKLYEPLLTKDGKFVATFDANKPQVIETHAHNVVRFSGENGANRYVVADSFYQKGPYRMGWVENNNPEVTQIDLDKDKGTKLDVLKLSGGEVEAVVCERDPVTHELKLGKDGFPKPLMKDGKIVTEKRPLQLVTTKYSSTDRLEIGAPGPEDRLNGTSREPGRPLLAERLENPERKADYIKQEKFVVEHHGKVPTNELKEEHLGEAKSIIARQEAALPHRVPSKPEESPHTAPKRESPGPKPHAEPHPQPHQEPHPQPKAAVAEHRAAPPTPKPVQPQPTVEHAPVERVSKVRTSVEGIRAVHSQYGEHAGVAQGAASVLLDVARGDYQGATKNAAIQVALNPKTYKAAAELTHDIAPVAKSLGFIGKKIPLVGAFVTAGFVAYEVGSDIYEGHYGKAGTALVAGVAETVASSVGFGAGDLAREGVRLAVHFTVGDKYEPQESGLLSLGKGAYALAKDAVDKQNAAAHHQPGQHPQAQPGPAQPAQHPQGRPPPSAPPQNGAPSIYHYKNLPVVGYVLKDTPNSALNGRPVRTPDGFIKNLRDIDMSDPKNLRAFEDAIHRRISKDQQQIEASKPKGEIEVVSSFLGMRSADRKVADATVEVRQLQGALRELEMFKKAVGDHHGGAPAAPHAGDSKFHSGGHPASGHPASEPAKPPEKPRQPAKPAKPALNR